MTKEEALKLFYNHNKIDILSVADENSSDYNEELANLSSQIDLWLSDIDLSDHELFLQLLSQYTYLTHAECQRRYQKVVELLEHRLLELGYHTEDVLVITVESTKGIKSGGDNVRSDFQVRSRKKFSKDQIVSSIHVVLSNMEQTIKAESLQETTTTEHIIDDSDALKKAVDIRQFPVVLFLDDVIGSGSTLKSTIKLFYVFCQSHNIPPQKLFYSCIAPRRKGLKHIEEELQREKIEAELLIDKTWCLDAAFGKNSNDYKRMENYEERIGTYLIEPEKPFFMGFLKNRMLLSFYYNTPNNTLSSFWREIPQQHEALFYQDGNQPRKTPQSHKALFYRDGNQPTGIKRPSVRDLQGKKKDHSEAAYQYGIAKTMSSKKD